MYTCCSLNRDTGTRGASQNLVGKGDQNKNEEKKKGGITNCHLVDQNPYSSSDNMFKTINEIQAVITNTKLNSGRLNSFLLNLGINKGSLFHHIYSTLTGFLPVLMRHYKGVKCIKIRRSKTIYSDVMIGYVQNPNKTTKT